VENNHARRKSSKQKFIPFLASAFVLVIGSEAHAVPFQAGEVSGFIDTTLSSGVSLRVEERDPDLIGIANGGRAYSVNNDNGNRNFSKGKLTSAATKATHDIGLSYRNYSFFTRTTYFFDPVNRYKKELNHNQREKAGQGITLLDAYFQGTFKPGGRPLDIRFGRQVLNWGESTFISGGLSVTNPVDVAKIRLPGAEVREALLPSFMISDSYQITDRLSMDNFYIFVYDRTEFDVSGTFFSTDDVTGEGADGIATSGFGQFPEGTAGRLIRRTPDKKVNDNGQFGTAFRYISPSLNDAEFGFYFINYHNRVGVGSATSSTPGASPSLFLEYLENLQVYGLSISTDVKGIAVQGEYTYRPAFPLQIETNEVFAAAQYVGFGQLPAVTGPGQVVRGYKEFPINQLQATVSKAFGRQNPFKADEWIVIAEAAAVYVSHFPHWDDLRFEGPGTNLSAYGGVGSPALETSGWADEFSWGYVVGTTWTYSNFYKNVALIPRFAFSHNVNGTSPQPISLFLDGRMSLSFGVTARYLEKWSLDVNYTNFSGAGFRNSINDRDFVSLTVKHWF